MIPELLPPSGFGVRLSRRTEVRDGGALLTGRSGSVLFLSAPAREVVARLPLVLSDDPTEARVARELLDRGLAEPCWPGPPPADDAVADVTVVVPVRDRPLELARLLRSLPTGIPVVVVDDASREPGARRPRGGRPAGPQRRPGRGPQRGAGAGADAVRRLRRLRRRARARLARPPAPAPRRPGGRAGRATRARARGAGGGLVAGEVRAGPVVARPRRRPGGGTGPRAGVVRARRLPARPRRCPRGRVRRGHAGRRGRRPRVAAGPRRVDGAVRAGGARAARPPHPTGGVVAAQGVLRHLGRGPRGPARGRGRAAGRRAVVARARWRAARPAPLVAARRRAGGRERLRPGRRASSTAARSRSAPRPR